MRSIKCPHCGQVMKAPEEAAGKRVNCPACKKAFLAPSALATPAKPKGPPPVAGSGRIWHLHVDGRNEGPYTADAIIEQMKTGKIGSHTLVWKEGMDDWEQMAHVPEFRGALSTPPPATRAASHAPHRPGADEEEEHPRRHVRGRDKHDAMIGMWVAVGIAVVLIASIPIIVNMSNKPKSEDEEEIIVRRIRKPQESPPSVEPSTPTPSGPIVQPGPRPVHPPVVTVKTEVSNEKLLTNLAADVAEGFKAAIAGHKKGDAKPIGSLILKLKKHAEQLGSRQWKGYESVVETLAKRLQDASAGMHTELKPIAERWDLGGEGLPDETRAKVLELDKYQWIERWQKILDDDLKRLRDKGLQF
jgi:hypothetical protein